MNLQNLAKMNKALVPAGVAVVLFALSQFGITKEMRVEDLVTFFVTSGLVWLTPNKS